LYYDSDCEMAKILDPRYCHYVGDISSILHDGGSDTAAIIRAWYCNDSGDMASISATTVATQAPSSTQGNMMSALTWPSILCTPYVDDYI
jgi:hypothetical protein